MENQGNEKEKVEWKGTGLGALYKAT